MKDKNRDKYVSASHFDHLLNDWQRFTQGIKSAKDYVTQFDEFLIRCSTLVPKSFPDLGLVLEKAYEQNCWLEELPNLRRPMHLSKI